MASDKFLYRIQRVRNQLSALTLEARQEFNDTLLTRFEILAIEIIEAVLESRGQLTERTKKTWTYVQYCQSPLWY